jgi:Tol biopolymer transport system component
MLLVMQRDQNGTRILHQLDPVDTGKAVFSPDGDSVAYVQSPRRQIRIVSLQESERQPVEFVHDIPGWPLVWSPDSASIIYSDRQGVFIINRDGSGLRRLTELSEPVVDMHWVTPELISFVHASGLIENFVLASDQ